MISLPRVSQFRAFFCTVLILVVVAAGAKKEIYDDIVEDFAAIKSNAFMVEVEEPTFLEKVGDLTGLTVLDMACGSGHYTRLMLANHPKHITCVDISEQMIEMGKSIATPAELEVVTFQVGSAATYKADKQVDIVTAQYLMNYATTREELDLFALNAFASLRTGGRIVSMMCYYSDPMTYQAGEGWYLNIKSDGVSADVVLFSADEKRKVTVPVILWTLDTLKDSLDKAGFSGIEVHTFGDVPVAILSAEKSNEGGVEKSEL
ncbi:hypothetical protein ACA910_019509 [Epithemia clementina (nom. ined.)]